MKKKLQENLNGIDNAPLTYDFLALNLLEINKEHKLSLQPKGMYAKDGKYFITVQLDGNCDVDRHISVYNEENAMIIRLEDTWRSNIKRSQMPFEFTIGTFKNMLRFVGLNDVADNLMTEEQILK